MPRLVEVWLRHSVLWMLHENYDDTEISFGQSLRRARQANGPPPPQELDDMDYITQVAGLPAFYIATCILDDPFERKINIFKGIIVGVARCMSYFGRPQYMTRKTVFEFSAWTRVCPAAIR